MSIPQTALIANESSEALRDTSLALTYEQAGLEPTPYRLFLPKPFDANKKYPLILWLHGYGDNDLSQIKHINKTVYRKGLNGPASFFLVAPQLSRKRDLGWEDPVNHWGNDSLDIAMRIIYQVKESYPIDDRRISAIGISNGGDACLALAERHGDRFAAMTVHASSGRKSKDFPREQVLTTIWAFHETLDSRVPVLGIRKIISDLQVAGGVADVTEIQDHFHSIQTTAHNCWNTAFAQHDLLYWLLSQKRGEPSPRPRQYRLSAYPRVWWSRLNLPLLLFGLIVASGVVGYRYVSRRRIYFDNLLPEVFTEEPRKIDCDA